MLKRADFLWIIPAALALGAVLTLVSPGGFLPGWLAFSLLFMLGLIGLVTAWRLAGAGRALAWILVLGLFLRLALGAGVSLMLPVIGHDSEPERAGYLFYDAFRRDTQAWELAQSSNSLSAAFDEKQVSDQYGGLLWISVVIYRGLTPDAHRPLLMVLLAAMFNLFGAVFLWATAKRLSGENLALVATFIFVFLPEAILQGSAQMREPFLMTFIVMAFYSLVEWQNARDRLSWLWMGLALVGMLLVSPGFVLLTLVVAGGWLYFSEDSRRIPWQAALTALAIFGVALVVLSLSWNSLVNTQSGPLGVIGDWARETAKWNQQILKQSSGIVQLLFEKFPSGLQMPFVAIYGILQPVLPAAIFEPSIPFWQILGTVRAVGWYLLLPFLAYALFSTGSLGSSDRRRWLWLGLVIWVWIIIASLRGGADQWDNPRYRVILLGWQAMLAAQAWLSIRAGNWNRWLIRIVAVEAIILLVFTHWYMYRYLKIGFDIGIRNTLAIAIGGSLLLVLADWVVEKRLKKGHSTG